MPNVLLAALSLSLPLSFPLTIKTVVFYPNSVAE